VAQPTANFTENALECTAVTLSHCAENYLSHVPRTTFCLLLSRRRLLQSDASVTWIYGAI